MPLSEAGTIGRRARLGVAIAALVCAACGVGRCTPGVADRSVVAVARARKIMVQDAPMSPYWLYPEGRVDYGTVDRLLAEAVQAATGTGSQDAAWRSVLGPNDRVGIQLDAEGIRAHDVLLEALIRQIMDAGVPLRSIIIYSGDETALFRAGFDLSGRAPGARVMASDDQGYRHGLSRIVLDYCTVVVGLCRLRVDAQIGMYGALANCLMSFPYVERERLRRSPEMLGEAGANSTLRRKNVMQVVDALRPTYRLDGETGEPQTWLYRGVLASRDPVAVDVVGRQVLLEGLREHSTADPCLAPRVSYLEPATQRYRLGNSDPDRIDVIRIGP